MSEKNSGRKFGFNVVDVIIVVVVAAALFFGVQKLQGSGVMEDTATYHVTYTVLCEEQPVGLYDGLKDFIPSQLMASGELFSGEIVSVERQPYMMYVDGQWVEDIQHENLLFTIEASFADSGVLENKLGKQELRVGKTYIVKSQYLEIADGIITSMIWHDGQS